MRSELNQSLRWTLWRFEDIKPDDGPSMTVNGTTTKLLVLLFLFVAGFVFSWNHFHTYHWNEAPTQKINTLLGELPAWRGNLLFTQFRFPLYGWALFFVFLASGFLMKRGLVVLAPICVMVEGVSWGAVEYVLQERYPGVTLLSGVLAVGLLLSLLAVYRLGFVDSENFIVAFFGGAIGAVAFAYAALWYVKGIGIDVPLLHQRPTAQTCSVLVFTAAGSGLLVNLFARIDKAIQAGAPKWAEWRAALALFACFLGLMSLLRTALLNRSTRQLLWDSVSTAFNPRK